MTRSIILAIICVAFGCIIGYAIARKVHRENEDILLNEVTRSREKSYTAGFAAGSKDAMDAFDQALIDMETGNQGENEMDDMEQGHVPAEDMGVVYRSLGVDPGTGKDVYECGECFTNGTPVPPEVMIEKGPNATREALFAHASQHGFSAFTIDNGKKEDSADVPSILFKRVTAVRDEQGYHRYECSADMEIVPQGGAIKDHMKHDHKGLTHYFDHEPVADCWTPGERIIPIDKTNFKYLAHSTEGLKFSPAAIKAQLDRLVAPAGKPFASFAKIEGYIAATVKEVWDRVGEQIPDGFDGTVESEDGPFGRTAMLAGLDKKTVPFKNGHTIAFVDNDGKLTWGD